MDNSKEILDEIEEFIENRISEIEHFDNITDNSIKQNDRIRLIGEHNGYIKIKNIIKKYK
jgi:hypothetical protein